MAERITLTADVPVVIKGRSGQQLADADQVYTWDTANAEYGPQGSLDRLVTHDPAGTGSHELVFHSDGSVVWH